jgi:bis(5'-nucleosyl)-tetraphosphatase (symmetrical)
MEIKRHIIVGDIHGCIDEFDELVNALSYDKKNDRLILLGDLIDRGPDSVAVVRRAREMGLECVMGNHEHKFVKWHRSVGTSVDVYESKPHYTQFSDADVMYIMQMSDYIELPQAIVVHAGLRAGISLQNQKRDDLYYIRYMTTDSKFVSLKKINRLGKEATDAHFWTEFWTGPQSVVYGHNVNSYEDPLIEEVAPGVTCYGIDTGCCFGGRLTALILETKQIVQVQAKQVYYRSDFDIR